MMQLDLLDKKLLHGIQESFPLVERPYLALGERLGSSETEVMERMQRLKTAGIVRQLSAIFDTRMLGYTSSLVAMAFPEDVVDQAAAIISSHPGVSHNYRRDHRFNLWFTVAIPPGEVLEPLVNRMGEVTHAQSVRLLPTLRLYKIGVNLDVMGDRAPDAKDETKEKVRRSPRKLNEADIAFVRVFQEDLPITAAPFQPMAEQLGMELPVLFDLATQFQEEGLMRRYAAVLRHQQAGFTANGMAVWVVPEDRVDEIGYQMARFKTVSHCYRRPVYPDWPYNVFTMIHGRSREDCERVADAIQQETGIEERQMLYSTKEYKKERVKYFVEAEWKYGQVLTT